jgi:hypothetical protein
MEMLGLPSQEGGGIGDGLTASEEALRFGWASWAIHGLFKKLTDCNSYVSLLCLNFFLRVSSVPIPTAPHIIIGRGTLKANACVEQSGCSAPSELS